MIQVENVTINGREFTHTFSDAGYYVTRDGQNYIEAYDPINSGRTYTEGGPIPEENHTAEEILTILLGGENND